MNPYLRELHSDIGSYRCSPAGAPAPGPTGAGGKQKHKKSKRKLAGWILGFIAGAFAGILSGFVFSLLFKLALALVKGKGKGSGPAIYSSLIKKAEDLAFLEKEDGLASLEIIGRGGCGEVYKAELPGSNGKMIAIKKIIQPPKDAAELAEEDSKILHTKMRQIKSEIDTVGQIRHRNLLPLLAHISRPDCHYLVYEFMKNGSLQDMLTKVERGEAELDWLSRHKIALGVAAGLEYLHMSHSPRIIHRDLKPANILLDDDMEARIADFGLAKTMPDAQTHISTSKVAGTVGYIAPEYHQIFKFSDKCDIYSFGVMLGVLVMGKLPSDDFFQHTDEMSLVKWMRNTIISENPKDAIDARLIGNGFEEQMLLVLKIACFCTMDNPKERPDSKNVRIMLYQIKH
jgi:serine/threonine protein kinase